jgi:hypothetical protein
MLTNYAFWDHFETEFVLVMQTDTLILKPIPELYFTFDYCGAPWKWIPNGCGRMVGNGGFSLRRVSVMKEICVLNTYDGKEDLAEDIFFAKHVKKDGCPPVDLAKNFSVEHIYSRNPCGLHQVWRFQTISDIRKWINGMVYSI